MFTLTVFEILLSEGRSVLSPAQRVTGSERVKKTLPFVVINENQIVVCIPKFIFIL